MWRGRRTGRVLVRGLAAIAVLLAGTPEADRPAGTARAATPATPTPAPALTVEFFSVGQGDAALVTSPTGKRVLIDGGPPEAGQGLVETLRERGGRVLDLVMLSHRHADHLGGLRAVVRDLDVKLFMDAAYPHPTPLYGALLRTIEERRVPLRNAEMGRRVDLGGDATLVLLGPPSPPITGSRSDVNANSVVLLLEFGTVRFLFTGDAEAATERWLLGWPGNLRATVLKVAHHGGRYSSGAGFLAAVRPEVAIVSAGAGNRYGHPHPDTLARLGAVGARVFRTDVDGHVIIETDGKTYRVRTRRTSKDGGE